MTLSNRDIDSYFNKIGYAGTFPFENLDVVPGRPVRLDTPASRFIQNLTLARPGPQSRAALLNDRLTIRLRGGEVQETVIQGVRGLAGALAEHFALDLFAIAGDSGAKAIVERYFPHGSPALDAGR